MVTIHQQLMVATGQNPSAAYGGNILLFGLVFFTLVFLSGAHL
jgi:hypothetical protein